MERLSMNKILIIQENLCGGGAEKVLTDILNNFDYDRYSVTLLLKYPIGVFMDRIPPQVRVLSFNQQKRTLFERIACRFFYPLEDRYLSWRLQRILADEQFDTIISFMEGMSARLHSLILDRAPRHLTWVHTDVLNNHWYYAMFKNGADHEFYKKVDEIIFVSQGAKENFSERYNTERKKHVLYNLIDRKRIIELASQDPIPTNRVTICTVGRLVEVKQQKLMIKLMSVLKNRGLNLELWLVGVGSIEQELKELAKKLAVDDQVIFWGFQSNPYRFIKSADIFLLTSLVEGFPLVICEALSLGKPIVSTNVVGPKELLEGGFGILCDTEEELAKAVEQLYYDAEARLHYAKMSAQKGLQFDPKSTMNQIYDLISKPS